MSEIKTNETEGRFITVTVKLKSALSYFSGSRL